MERIDSPQNSFLKQVKKEANGKGDTFLVEGFHLVEEAIRYRAVDLIFSQKPYSSPYKNILLSEKAFLSLSNQKTPEGVIAMCHKRKDNKIEGERILYLDGVQDPGNVGTLMRTALAFLFATVIIPSGTARPYSPKVIQASQGAIFALNVIETQNDREEDFSLLERRNYQIFTTSLQGNDYKDYSTFKNIDSLCLVLGNEGEGVSKEAIKHAKYLAKLPISHIDSLNVGVAGGIFMYLLKRH